MKKTWRVIAVIIMACFLLGAVSIGVGLITGASGERIFSVLDSKYYLSTYYEAYVSYFNEALDLYSGALSGQPAA